MAPWDALAEAPDELPGGSLVAARKQNAELVTAQPRDEVHLPKGHTPPQSALAEELVTGRVTRESSFTAFNPSRSRMTDRNGLAGARTARGSSSDQPSVPGPPVRKAGKRVLVGQRLQLTLEPLSLGDVPSRCVHAVSIARAGSRTTSASGRLSRGTDGRAPRRSGKSPQHGVETCLGPRQVLRVNEVGERACPSSSSAV